LVSFVSGVRRVRRFVVLIASIMCLSAPANAGPGADFAEFAETLRTEASVRADWSASRPAAPASPLDIEDPFMFELEQFSADAMRLSRAIDDAGGPMDLRCIFRGMSNDAASRLEALNEAETAADQARIYRAIVNLMRDAVEIAPVVDHSDLPDGYIPPLGCGVSAG
jgi:hypothetical protein